MLDRFIALYSLPKKIIIRTAYGIDVLPHDDPYIKMAERTRDAIAFVSSLSGLILDLVPFCMCYSYW
jgi:hypothetical protein